MRVVGRNIAAHVPDYLSTAAWTAATLPALQLIKLPVQAPAPAITFANNQQKTSTNPDNGIDKVADVSDIDGVANIISWVVLIVIPIGAIALFWFVHIWPDTVAKKRQHPQRDAIHALCVLSLFFGGLLWPFAYLWAYTKPTMYKLAYGTDKYKPLDSTHGESSEK